MSRTTIVATTALVVVGTTLAFTHDRDSRFREFLNGFKEAAAVVSTTGSGTFRASISNDETKINYTLTFRDLEGDVTQAHIHIGHPQNSGSIVLWLCDSAASPAPSDTTPACTVNNPMNTRAGMVTGTLTANDVQNLPANGIAGATPTTPGEFAEVIALIRAGRTYVNVHSSKFPPGEIRSQINDRDHDRHEHDHD